MGLLDRLRGRPTPDDFAAMMLRGLAQAGTRGYRYDRDESRLVRVEGDKPVAVIGLANMHATYLAKPGGERAAYLKTCVRSALATQRSLPEDFGAARPDLRAKVWSRAGLEQAVARSRLEGMGEGPDIPTVPLGEHLLVSVAFDWPEATQSVNREDLERWGVTIDEALEAGKENLEATMKGYARIGEHLAAFMPGDSYDACRVLLVDRIRDMGMKGRPVAMVPNRKLAYVTGEDDPEGLAMMADLAAEPLADPYGLSGVPLVLDGDTWVDWMPPPGHPSHRAFRDLEVKTLGPMYQAQEELLNRLHERDGVGVFVASFSAVEKPDNGGLVSYCVWGNGVDALLPVTQKIIFFRELGERPAAIGEFDRVREVAGDLMEPTDHYPPRYRVRESPDEAALAAIGLGEL
jgi:hypothetical protein